MGPQRDLFEKELAEFVDTRFAVAVSSGTAALHAAYAAAGISAGDEVIVPAMTFASTATAALHLGAEIKVADVDPETGLVDPASVDALISERTKAIVGVDYAGQPCDIEGLKRLTQTSDITVISDSAHSLGSSLNGRAVGGLADVTCFSMFATKNVAAGEGGAVVTNSAELGSRARRFSAHGIIRGTGDRTFDSLEPWFYDVAELGLNYRPSEMQMALARSQLSQIKHFRAKRQEIFARYVRELREVSELALPEEQVNAEIMWHLFPVRVRPHDRLALFNYLHSQGVIVQVNYRPIYFNSLFLAKDYPRGLCPGAEKFYAQEVSLPMHAALTSRDQGRVIRAIKRFYSK